MATKVKNRSWLIISPLNLNDLVCAWVHAYSDEEDVRVLSLELEDKKYCSFYLDLTVVSLRHENIMGSCVSFEAINNRSGAKYVGRYNFYNYNDCWLTQIS